MADTHRSHDGRQRHTSARVALAAVVLQRKLLQRHPHPWPHFQATYTYLQQLPHRWRPRLVRMKAEG